jgi:hypothetical protein
MIGSLLACHPWFLFVVPIVVTATNGAEREDLSWMEDETAGQEEHHESSDQIGFMLMIILLTVLPLVMFGWILICCALGSLKGDEDLDSVEDKYACTRKSPAELYPFSFPEAGYYSSFSNSVGLSTYAFPEFSSSYYPSFYTSSEGRVQSKQTPNLKKNGNISNKTQENLNEQMTDRTDDHDDDSSEIEV